MTLPWLDLPLVWAGLIAFAVLAYVVMDGFATSHLTGFFRADSATRSEFLALGK